MKKEDLKIHLAKVNDELQSELTQIRTGRATSAILEGILVEAYAGTAPMPVNELGTVAIPDASSVTITPWDKSVLGKVEDALRKANRGLNPVNEGDLIRIPVPILTEDSRKEKVKEVFRKVEESKIKVRNLRQNAISAVEEMEENKVISQDDMYRQKEELEKMIKDTNLKLEQQGELKEKELMQL